MNERDLWTSLYASCVASSVWSDPEEIVTQSDRLLEAYKNRWVQKYASEVVVPDDAVFTSRALSALDPKSGRVLFLISPHRTYELATTLPGYLEHDDNWSIVVEDRVIGARGNWHFAVNKEKP